MDTFKHRFKHIDYGWSHHKNNYVPGNRAVDEIAFLIGVYLKNVSISPLGTLIQ